MPTFRYRAYGVDGDFAEGVIEAASQDVANNLLWSKGLTPFEMRTTSESGVKWWQREVFSSGSTKLNDLAAFTREFATLNAAEIPLDDALRILRDQASSARVRNLVNGLLSDVLNGAALSDAMQKRAEVFPADYISMVRAGEIGGTDSQVFMDLAELLERRIEIRTRVQSALIYPCILAALSLGTLAIVIGGLIPSIVPIFAENGKPMPVTIQFFSMLQARWFEVVVGISAAAAVMIGTISVAAKKPAVRLAFDSYRLKLPIIGTFTLQQETARFSRTLGTMLKAGVPLLQAASAARNVVGNRHIAAGLDRTIEALHRGVALHRALQTEAALPTIALQMISVGEEAGKLDRMLTRVAIMYERQTQTNVERFIAALTPVLTIGIAVIVGALIIPVMNAVLSINELAIR